MNILHKICIVTSTRADYGILYCLMKEIKAEQRLELQIIATGMHLSPEFGLTYRVIEQDGFNINAKVEMLLSSDTPVGITKSIGLGVIGFADAIEHLKPDILIILGDRFEILAAAQAAMVARVPIAHIAGGDTTEGAFDEAIRHAITKMSHLHFVTNEIAQKRVRQLGENPANIFNVGSPGIDQIKNIVLLDRNRLEEDLGFKFHRRNLLITFHPATLEEELPKVQFRRILDGLERLGPEIGLIFTKPNADTNGRSLSVMIDQYVSLNSNARAYVSLGQLRYLSTIAYVDAVVGNSSSGLYEVPTFRKPTVNIGDRQKGRLKANSVIDCQPEAEEVYQAINKAFTLDCSDVTNPYGDGNASLKIVQILKQETNFKRLLKKHFYEVITVD